MSGNEVILNVPLEHTCGNARVRILQKTLCLQIYGKENSIESYESITDHSSKNVKHQHQTCQECFLR